MWCTYQVQSNHRASKIQQGKSNVQSFLGCDQEVLQVAPASAQAQLPTNTTTNTTVLRPFFPGPPRWAGARRELLDFMVQGKINRGRHTDHPAGHHTIRTNQCPPPSPPHIFCRPDALRAAQPTVSKHWRQTNNTTLHNSLAAAVAVCHSCQCQQVIDSLLVNSPIYNNIHPTFKTWRTSIMAYLSQHIHRHLMTPQLTCLTSSVITYQHASYHHLINWYCIYHEWL